MTGRAIMAGCETLLDAMRKPDGSYRTYEEMQAEDLPVKYDGQWTTPCTVCDENGQGEPFPVYMYGVFMAEVAVDSTSGKTTAEKMTLVADIGKINNRLVTDGQIYGGLAQGIGLALCGGFRGHSKAQHPHGRGLSLLRTDPR